MKAEKLMVGDLADYGIGESSYIMKTTSEHIYNNSDCKPIPITPEILVKNGFKKWNSGDYEYQHKEDAMYVFQYIDSDIWSLGIDSEIAKLDFNFRYVHELQHAMRLCKIDKEIVL